MRPIIFGGVLFVALFAGSASSSPAVLSQVPAVYVFGDSTADVGNNNYLPGNNAKANFPHYGVDFPHQRATGRFSNGYNGIDFMAINIGFRRSPPPYLSIVNSTSNQILKGLRGVNFASGGSGILDTTGSTITMTKQIEYFSNLKAKIVAHLGAEKTNDLLSKSIFIVSSGGNDVFAFAAQNSSPNSTQIAQFFNLMLSKYQQHFQSLYDLGARKFAIVDVPFIGCTPYARFQNPTGACIDSLNGLAKSFNNATKLLLQSLSTTMEGMKYSIGSSYNLVSSIIANPQGVGFEEVKSACCGSGKLNAATSCAPNTTYCGDRGRYLFWDRIHPTHATSKKAGLAFYSGSLEFASPINLKQLVDA